MRQCYQLKQRKVAVEKMKEHGCPKSSLGARETWGQNRGWGHLSAILPVLQNPAKIWSLKKICLLPEQLIMQQRLIRDGAVVKTVNQLFTHLISSPKFISFRVFMTVSSTNLHAYTSPHETITEGMEAWSWGLFFCFYTFLRFLLST